MTTKPKIPILLYEEPKPGQPVNPIPYLEIGLEEEMPKVLFISEYKDTGEFEVDAEFGSSKIVDMLIHKYVDLEHLKDILDEKTYDKIRVALGMKPLKEAQKNGQQVLNKVFNQAEQNKKELMLNKDKRSERAFILGEDFKRKAEQFMKDNKDKT